MKAFFHYYFSVEGKTLSCFSSSPPKCYDLDVPAVNWQLFHFLLAFRAAVSLIQTAPKSIKALLSCFPQRPCSGPEQSGAISSTDAVPVKPAAPLSSDGPADSAAVSSQSRFLNLSPAILPESSLNAQ